MNATPHIRIAAGLLACLLSLLSSTGSARAAFVGNLLEINVSAGGLTGSWILDVPLASSPYEFDLTSPVEIYSIEQPGTLLASIDDLSLILDGDPQAILSFAVTAGGVDTNFSLSTAVVSFSALANPESFATATVTVTDNNANGASVTGNFPGTKSYQATYNGGSVFADLVSPVIAPTNGSNIGMERNPAFGTVPIPGLVTSIQAEYNFTLTAADSASGTSNFTVIVPEPSSMILALLGALAAVWLGRRR